MITHFIIAVTTQPSTEEATGMSDLFKIVLTAAIGAFLGVVTFVVGQIIQRIFIEPIQEQRKIVGKIVHALCRFQNSYLGASWQDQLTGKFHEDSPSAREAKDAIFLLAQDLKASVKSIPHYDFWERNEWVVSRSDVGFVSQLLMLWQGNFTIQMSSTVIAEIRQRLKIDFGEDASAAEIKKWTDDHKALWEKTK